MRFSFTSLVCAESFFRRIRLATSIDWLPGTLFLLRLKNLVREISNFADPRKNFFLSFCSCVKEQEKWRRPVLELLFYLWYFRRYLKLNVKKYPIWCSSLWLIPTTKFYFLAGYKFLKAWSWRGAKNERISIRNLIRKWVWKRWYKNALWKGCERAENRNAQRQNGLEIRRLK